MTVSLPVFEGSRLHRIWTKNGNYASGDTEPGTPDLTARRQSSGSEGLADDAVFLYLGGPVIANTDIMPEIKRWILFARAYHNRFKREL